jgi:3-oxoadipate enol-lactonase
MTSVVTSFALLVPTLPVLAQVNDTRAVSTDAQTATVSAPTQALSFFTTGDGTRIAYRLDGSADRPVVVLANSIGTNMHMWDSLIAALSDDFRVLRYDMRGHGASDVPDGAYAIGRFGGDVIELLDALGIQRVHFIGLSLGGFVGQWLAIHNPERIDRLILTNTAAYLGPAEQWDPAITAVLEAEDMHETAETFLRNWFAPHLLEAESAVVQKFRTMLLETDQRGIAGSWALVRDTDMRRTIALISRPTLIIAGEHDLVTTVAHGKAMAATIPNARLLVLPAAHMTHIEYPAEFMEAVLAFLRALAQP